MCGCVSGQTWVSSASGGYILSVIACVPHVWFQIRIVHITYSLLQSVASDEEDDQFIYLHTKSQQIYRPITCMDRSGITEIESFQIQSKKIHFFINLLR